MKGKTGFIDGRRIRVGGVPIWSPVPGILVPGSMEAYGILDEFIGVEQLALGGHTKDWEFWVQNSASLRQGDLAGGIASILCGGADNDSGQIILGALAGGGAFFPAATRHLWFEARVRAHLVAVGTLNYFIGLIDPVNAAILADNGGALPNNDMLGFVVRDGEANWSFVGDNAGAEDMNALGGGCVVDNAWHYFGFYINGVTNVAVYYDRALIAAGAIATANIPITGLMPSMAVKAGVAAAEAISVDYIMCAQLR